MSEKYASNKKKTGKKSLLILSGNIQNLHLLTSNFMKIFI